VKYLTCAHKLVNRRHSYLHRTVGQDSSVPWSCSSDSIKSLTYTAVYTLYMQSHASASSQCISSPHRRLYLTSISTHLAVWPTLKSFATELWKRQNRNLPPSPYHPGVPSLHFSFSLSFPSPLFTPVIFFLSLLLPFRAAAWLPQILKSREVVWRSV